MKLQQGGLVHDLYWVLQTSSGVMNGRRRSSTGAWDPNSWKEECESLLQSMFDSEDSGPFRQPVDVEEVPVWRRIRFHFFSQ